MMFFTLLIFGESILAQKGRYESRIMPPPLMNKDANKNKNVEPVHEQGPSNKCREDKECPRMLVKIKKWGTHCFDDLSLIFTKLEKGSTMAQICPLTCKLAICYGSSAEPDKIKEKFGNCWKNNAFFVGTEISILKNITKTSKCQEKCKMTPNCDVFSHNIEKNGRCSACCALKSGVWSDKTFWIDSIEGWISGPRDCSSIKTQEAID